MGSTFDMTAIITDSNLSQVLSELVSKFSPTLTLTAIQRI